MPAAIIAVAAAVAGYGIATSTVVIGALTSLGAVAAGVIASTAIGYIGNQLFAPEIETYHLDFQRGLLMNKASTTAPIPIVYGSRRVGGARVFLEVSGESNEYLHLVYAFCEGPVGAINTVYLNDVASTDAKFSGYVTIKKHLGEDNQAADADLIAACPSSWTSDHRLRGVAYIYVKLKYSTDVFPGGLPVFTADIDGMRVYDPRSGVTASTHNPALNMRDYLIRTRGGCGITSSLVPDAHVIAAANYCDELVTVGGVQQARYTCDGVVDIDTPLFDNVREMLLSFRGMLIHTAGEYRLLVDKPEASTFAFTEDNITGSWVVEGGTKKNMLNRLKVRFFNPDRSWQEEISVIDSPTLRTQDNERVLERQISLPFTADINTARQIATIELNQSREPIVCQFTALISGLTVEAGNVVSITHSTPGWSAKKFRVMKMQIKNDDEVIITAREYADEVYDFGTILTVDPTPNTNLPDVTTSRPPTNLHVTTETYIAEQTLMARALLTWDPPADAFVVSYDVGYKLHASADWIYFGSTKATSMIIPGLTPGASYDFRVRSINTMYVASGWLTSTGEILGSGISSPATPDLDYEIVGETVVITWADCATSLPIAYYTVNGMSIGNACTYTERITWTGGKVFNVIAYDIDGNSSSTGSVTVTITVLAAGTGLVTEGLPYAIRLTLSYTPGEGFDAVEIWSSTLNDRATARKVGETGGTTWTHTGLNLIDTRYYWFKVRDIYGNYSAWYPESATGGVEGSTSTDPADYLTILEGSLTDDQLATELLTRIAIIDTDFVYESGVFDVTDLSSMVFGGLDAIVVGLLNQDVVNAECINDLLSTASEHAEYISSMQAEIAGLTSTEWSDTQSYTIGRYVVHNGIVYRCIQPYDYPPAREPGVDTAYWEEADTIITLVSDVETRVDTLEGEIATKASTVTVDMINNRVSAAESNIIQHSTDIQLRVEKTEFDAFSQLFIPDFSTGNTYAVNDFVRYGGSLYRCIQTIDFTPAPLPTDTSYWEPADFADQFSSTINQIELTEDGISLISSAIIGPVTYLFSSDIERIFEHGVYIESVAEVADLDIRVTQAGIDIDGLDAQISLHTMLIDGVNDRIASAEVNIDANAAAITLKAAQSEVNWINTRLSQAESEVNGLGTRLTQAEIDIDANAAAITERVATSIYNADQYSGGQLRVAAAETKISALQTDNNNMKAQYTVKLNVNKRVAGIGLMLSGSATSEFIVLANKFQVVNPEDTMGPKAVFTVGQINGVNAVGVMGDAIIDGSILARHIAASTITGNKISAATTITAGTGNDIGALSGSDATYRIYAGNATPSSAPFRVTKTGDVYAASGKISGNFEVGGIFNNNDVVRVGWMQHSVEVYAGAGVGWSVNDKQRSIPSFFLPNSKYLFREIHYQFWRGSAYLSAVMHFSLTNSGRIIFGDCFDFDDGVWESPWRSAINITSEGLAPTAPHSISTDTTLVEHLTLSCAGSGSTFYAGVRLRFIAMRIMTNPFSGGAWGQSTWEG